MRRIRIIGVCLVAVCALGAVTAISASATEKIVLKLSTAGKGLLGAGAELKGSSSNLIFETNAGTLECSSNVLVGTLANNSATKDKGSFTSESSTGGLSFEGKEHLCKTSGILGAVEIEAKNFPWPVEFTTKGTGKLKGTKKVSFQSTFVESGNIKCTFEAGKVAFTHATSGNLEIKTSNQLFKINKKTSNAACPKEGHLSGTFALTSGGETVKVEL
ncbi:MAG TPA: hypothetical protein VMG62_03175 [Solirubrobacteraceae bacterium]|nr:hypothetical protein [Solirubrobacteraceae bacterium]